MYRVGICARIRRVVFLLWLSSGLSVFLPFFVSAQVSIDLSWQPSPDTNIMGYNIYYGTSSRTYTNEISVGNATSTTISGLAGGITYYFAATAYDSAGDESDYSNEISYNVPTSVIFLSNLHPGSYGGLFYEQDAVRVQSSGGFSISVTAAGKYTGALQMSSGKLPFSGKFGTLCQATNFIARKNTNALMLSFSIGSSNQVLGNVSSDGQWTANLYGEHNGFQPANLGLNSGKYTVMIRGIKAVTNSLGHSFGTLSLSSAGLVHFAATLADGTKISQSVPVSQYGNWPLFVPAYSGQGLIISWIGFTNTLSSDLSGTLNWIKLPSAKSPLYQSGLVEQRPIMGAFYSSSANTAPALTNSALGLGGLLTGSNTNQILSLQFSKATGTFNGKLLDNIGGQPVTFQGAFIQKTGQGFGFVLGTNVSSPVVLFSSAP
jgi:hypothetical protein